MCCKKDTGISKMNFLKVPGSSYHLEGSFSPKSALKCTFWRKWPFSSTRGKLGKGPTDVGFWRIFLPGSRVAKIDFHDFGKLRTSQVWGEGRGGRQYVLNVGSERGYCPKFWVSVARGLGVVIEVCLPRRPKTRALEALTDQKCLHQLM